MTGRRLKTHRHTDFSISFPADRSSSWSIGEIVDDVLVTIYLDYVIKLGIDDSVDGVG